MKKIFSVVVIATICIPLALSAAERVKVNSAALQKLNKIPKLVKTSCPNGWSKVLDISGVKSKWSENSPVVTCKPNRGQVMNCPEGTYFYVKGNEYQDGYNSGAIGCHTPVK